MGDGCMKVVTVLNTYRDVKSPMKTEYTEAHVEMLRKQVAFYMPDAEFVVLRNEDYPGWWAKMHVFKITGKVLYLDLDTLVTGPCEFLKRMPPDFYALENVNKEGDLGSGVLYWDGDYSFLFDAFAKDPDRFMSEYTTGGKWGDQGFIRDHVGDYCFLPSSVISALKPKLGGEVPAGTDIVYFHGHRKPWNMEEWRDHVARWK